jgi:hypothetical protein
MAQADRPGHRLRKDNAEGAAGPIAAIVAGLAAEAFELDRPEPMGAHASLGQEVDPRRFGKVGAPLAQPAQLFQENQPDKLARDARLPQRNGISAAPKRNSSCQRTARLQRSSPTTVVGHNL